MQGFDALTCTLKNFCCCGLLKSSLGNSYLVTYINPIVDSLHLIMVLNRLQDCYFLILKSYSLIATQQSRFLPDFAAGPHPIHVEPRCDMPGVGGAGW